MVDWERALARVASVVEDRVDRVRGRRERTRPLLVVPFRGHGTREALHLTGRVLEDNGLRPAEETDSRWKNFQNTLRRLESDEVPDITVRARFGTEECETVTDEEGYFSVRITPREPLPQGALWHRVDVVAEDPLHGPAEAVGWVQVAPDSATFGVISDIDDTVVRTDVTRILSMIRLVLLTNAHTRLPFEGVAAFYRALQVGGDGRGPNPVFYVSSSPWNFYDLLDHVFEVHDIPTGTLFLKDYGLDRRQLFSRGHHAHKSEAIRELLATHPELPFVLLGDSGQEDPEIYRDAVLEHPGRIHAVYIRDVTHDARRESVQELIRELERAGVPMLLTPDTVTAARHAADLGLIEPAAVEEVAEEKARDEAAPTPVESLLESEDEGER